MYRIDRDHIASAFAALMLIASIASPALAETLTGNALLGECRAASGSSRSGFCRGFITGIGIAMKAGASINGSLACPPDGATDEQSKDVVLSYLERHAADRHYGAVFLVAKAFTEAFPCAPQ